jgi:hypothetical protein
MATQVTSTAMMMCPMGTTPVPLTVLPLNTTMAGNMPAANIMDNKPMVNIMTFGPCKSLAFPATAAATSAAQGVLTPMPCVPNTVAPWTPGSPTVLIGNMPAVNNTCKLMCCWGGAISITDPGAAMTVQIP